MSDEHVAELIDLYALGLLEPEEHTVVARHLEGCSTCRALLSDARRVVDALLWTPEQRTPPPELQGKVMRRMEQLQRSEQPATPLPRRRSRWTRGLRPWFSLHGGLAAVSLVLLGMMGTWNVALQRQVSSLRAELARQQQVVAVLRDVGARVVSFGPQPPAPNARGSMVINPAGTEAYLVADGLPQLPPDKAYQLWLIKGESRDSGGIFRVDERGSATLLVRAPSRLDTYNGSGITIEPASGSPGPTGARVLRSEAWNSTRW